MKKKKIWSSITRIAFALMFVASWAILGVALALKTAKVEIGGGITFTATDVYAKISGSVTGTKSSNPINEHDIDFNASTTSDFTVDDSWTKMNLDFQNANTPIVLTIIIENLSEERSLWVTFDENISVTNVNIARTSDGNSVDSFSLIEIPAKTSTTTSSKTFTITMSIDDKSKSVSDTFKFNVELSSEAILDESAYPTLSFDYTSSSHTVAVGENSSNPPSGELVIPSKILHDGEVYTVTSIKVDSSFSKISSIYIPKSIRDIGWAGTGDVSFGNLTSAIFENPNGWRHYDYDYDSQICYSGTPITSDLSDPAVAARFLNDLGWGDAMWC